MILLLLLAIQDREFTKPEQGIRFVIPAGWELRTEKLQYRWSGALCEFNTADVKGTAVLLASGGNRTAYADEREAGYQTVREVREIRRVREEEKGIFLVREFDVVYARGQRRELHAYAVRGSRNLEIAFWGDVDAARKDIEAILQSAEFRRAWPCPLCTKDTGAEAASCPSCGASLAAPDPALETWARRFGVRIVTDVSKLYPTKSGGERIVGRNAPADAVKEYAAFLAKELARYPDEVFEKLAIERIVLCTNLFGGSMRRGALCDYDTDTIHCDVLEGKAQKDYPPTVVHHELFHMMDMRDDGTTRSDAAWEALNASGFKYAPRKSGTPFDGFASEYAMTSVAKDKAELYAALMVRPKWARERAGTDRVFAAKIERLKSSLRAWCPKLDDAFWPAE
jgi:hypothetical protein